MSSAQWLEEYQTAGEAKFVCGATANNRRLLRKGNRIRSTDRPHLIAIVSEVILDDDMKTAKMTVRALMSVGMWESRVLMHTEDIKNAEAAALRIAAANRRGLPCAVGTAKGFAQGLDTQKSWGSIVKALEEICEASGLGLRHTLANSEALGETLELYAGVDRTSPESEQYVGYFGDDAGNLRKVRIVDSDAKYCNLAIVAGRGEGVARVVVEVDLSGGASGAARRELFVDAKDIQEKYQVEQADGNTESEA